MYIELIQIIEFLVFKQKHSIQTVYKNKLL